MAPVSLAKQRLSLGWSLIWCSLWSGGWGNSFLVVFRSRGPAPTGVPTVAEGETSGRAGAVAGVAGGSDAAVVAKDVHGAAVTLPNKLTDAAVLSDALAAAAMVPEPHAAGCAVPRVPAVALRCQSNVTLSWRRAALGLLLQRDHRTS